MKKNNYLLFLLLALLSLTACETTSWVAPPYTEVDKILGVQSGMTIDQVNNTLGISPYDIYIIDEGGGSVLVYNYLRRNRKLEETPMEMNRTKHEQSGLTKGDTWYDVENPSQLYVYFRDGRVVSLVSDAGRDDAAALIITSNKINLISSEDLACYPDCGGDRTMIEPGQSEQQSSVVPLQNNREKPQTKTETKKSTTSQLLAGCAAVLLVGALAGLIVLLVEA